VVGKETVGIQEWRTLIAESLTAQCRCRTGKNLCRLAQGGRMPPASLEIAGKADAAEKKPALLMAVVLESQYSLSYLPSGTKYRSGP